MQGVASARRPVSRLILQAAYPSFVLRDLLHPALAGVHGLALKGQARIAPAIASPDRARSHFEAQDVLESGAAVVYGTSSGFLNRALEAMPAGKIEALSVGATAPLILRGKVQTGSWSPGAAGEGSPRLPGILGDLYANDPLLGPALAKGLSTHEGKLLSAEVARDLDLHYTDPAGLLA